MATTMIGQQIPGGFSWTLTSKLGDILNQAEAAFGQRDMTWTILGVEFYHLPNPQVWYPGNRNHISIQLTIPCLTNLNEGVYQLAHEVVHCLSPTGGRFPANVLEEGIATFFAVDYTARNGHGDYSNIADQRYLNAYNLYKELIIIAPNIIRDIRQTLPTISQITAIDLTTFNNQIPADLANQLTQVFQ